MTKNEYKIGCFVGNLDEPKITVELLGPKDPEGKSEQQSAYVSIELPKTLHRKLASVVARQTRVAFEKKVKELEKTYDKDEE